jgi:hypothetical protein
MSLHGVTTQNNNIVIFTLRENLTSHYNEPSGFVNERY